MTENSVSTKHSNGLRWVERLLPLIFFLMGLFVTFNLHKGNKIRYAIWSDAEGYYLYLPGWFIYDGDYTQASPGEDGMKAVNCCGQLQDGRTITRYTSGVAMMQTPFFLVAHALTSWFRGPGTPPPDPGGENLEDPTKRLIFDRMWSEERGYATGFSVPYNIAILIASLFYLVLGLWFLKEVLKRFFSLRVALLTTATVFLGTNLFAYGLRESGMSHVYSFCLFAAFLYFLPAFLTGKTWWKVLAFGFVFGMIILLRPTNIFLGFLVLFWEVYSWKAFKKRIASILQRWKYTLAAAAFALLAFIPQMLYWKSAFGSYIAWSYGDEGFFLWGSMKFFHVLFHYQNGLFLYTPVMLFALLGLFWGIREKRISAPVILICFLALTYIFSSWWAWWFGGAFGHRCYVEWYAVLALPLGLVISKWLKTRKKWLIYAGWGLLLFFWFANVKMTYLYSPPWDGENWTFGSYLDVWKRVVYFWRFWP